MLGRNLWENLYKTKLISDVTSVWWSPFGEFSLDVDVEPKHNTWWIRVNFSDPTNRDLIYFHRKVWTTLYYYLKNRQQTSISHDSGTFVQINDVAQWINNLSKNIEDFGFIDVPIGDWLKIKVYWWQVRLNENIYEISDKLITLSDNATNYVFFDPSIPDIDVQTTVPDNLLLWEINTSSGKINSKTDITDKRAKEWWLKLSSDFKLVNNQVEAADYLQNKTPEAPQDWEQYARKNWTWDIVSMKMDIDEDWNTVVTDARVINFGTNMNVTDNWSWQVTITAESWWTDVNVDLWNTGSNDVKPLEKIITKNDVNSIFFKSATWEITFDIWQNRPTADTANSLASNALDSIGEIDGSVLVTEFEWIWNNDNDTTLATSAAIKDYFDSKNWVSVSDSWTNVLSLSTDINFGTNMNVSNDWDWTTTIDVPNSLNDIPVDLWNDWTDNIGSVSRINTANDINSIVTNNTLSEILFDMSKNRPTSDKSNSLASNALDDIGEIDTSVLITETDWISNNDNDTTIPTSAAVKDYADTNKFDISKLTEETSAANADLFSFYDDNVGEHKKIKANNANIWITWEIRIRTTNTAPTWWLISNWSAVSRSTYDDLFNVIWTTYWAWDWSTTFNLPNLQWNIPVGKDAWTFDTLWKTWWEENHQLTVNEMPSHTHDFETSTVSDNNGADVDGSNNWHDYWGSSQFTNPNANTWWDASHNNLQPYITLNYIIKT